MNKYHNNGILDTLCLKNPIFAQNAGCSIAVLGKIEREESPGNAGHLAF